MTTVSYGTSPVTLWTNENETLSDAWVLDNVDVTQPGDKGILVPARPGLLFLVNRLSIMVSAISGPVVSIAPLFSYGDDAPNYDNWAQGLMGTAANWNAGVGQIFMITPSQSSAPLIGGLPYHFMITGGITGPTMCRCLLNLSGWWVRAPGVPPSS